MSTSRTAISICKPAQFVLARSSPIRKAGYVPASLFASPSKGSRDTKRSSFRRLRLCRAPQGQFVYAVDTENKASIRPVTIGREVTNGWIVEKGLKPGDRIVTEGVIKVKPGAPVTIAEPRDSARTKAAQR